MKPFIYWLIIIELINLSISLVPIWNIEKSSIVLTKEDEITIFSKEENPKITLKKKFLNKSDGVKDQNYIKVNDNEEIETNWEDIGRIDNITKWGTIVCPQGKYFMQYYHEDGKTFTDITPDNFEDDNNIKDENDWELSCSPIDKRFFYFQGFLGPENIKHIYGYYYEYTKEPKSKKRDLKGMSLLDFYLSDQPNDHEEREYDMFSLFLKNSKIYANKFLLTINTDNDKNLDFNPNDENKFYLDLKKDYSYGYFNLTTNFFYWISTSKSNNFSSGVSTTNMTKDSSKVNLIRYNISPLQFLQNVTINKIKMIRNTRFAYYEIISIDDNNTYYGIIDIEKNQVIFNTNETLKIFKPLKNISMLAITEDNKIYQICLNRYEGDCVESCPSGKSLILDSEKGNHCEDKDTPQNCKDFLLIPEQICVSTCNTSIYTIISEEGNGMQKCGLCKDFYNDKQFKIFNEPECLETKPNGTFYLSEEFKILKRCDENCSDCDSYEKCNKCKIGFKKDDSGHCELISCHSNCEFCDENENCISCKNDLFLQENNCVENCSQGYYKQENKQQKSCLKCHKNCKTCSNGPVDENENCDECESNFYLIDDVKFPKNCVETCPEDLSISDNFCKEINGTENNDGDNPDYMLWIFIILFAILLLLISLCICKRHFSKNKKDVEIINDINTELQENNRIIE